MRGKPSLTQQERGFSLLEVLITISLILLLFSFLFSFCTKLEKITSQQLSAPYQKEIFFVERLRQDWQHAVLIPNVTPSLQGLSTSNSSFSPFFLLLTEEENIKRQTTSSSFHLLLVNYQLIPQPAIKAISDQYNLYRVTRPITDVSLKKILLGETSWQEEALPLKKIAKSSSPLLKNLTFFEISFLGSKQKNPLAPYLSLKWQQAPLKKNNKETTVKTLLIEHLEKSTS